MEKYKNLFKNIGILTISNLGSKILAFALVPLYTAVLSTEDYGNYDIIYTTITLLAPILTLNIADSAIRFLLDKNPDQTNICHICFKYTNISIAIVLIAALINATTNLIPLFNEYWLFFLLFYIASVYYTLAQSISRGLDKLKYVGIGGIVNSILMLSLNIIFLLPLKLGLNGFFLANIIANGVTSIYILSRKDILHILTAKTNARQNGNRQKELTEYSKPLMINTLGWWINNVSDRYIVTYMCGLAANGIYSIAYKLPTTLSIIQSIFNQAWLISVTKEYKNNNDKEFVNRIYHAYNTSMVFACSLLILLNKPIARILYAGDFFEAWKYVPFLLISVVFTAMGGALGAVFGAEKDTKILAKTTLVGSIANIALNILLIYLIGPLGAAISTAVSSFIVWIVRIIACRKYVLIRIGSIGVITYALLLFQAISYALLDNEYQLAIQLFLVFTIILINIKTVLGYMKALSLKRRTR